jgi:hypothetical protein
VCQWHDPSGRRIDESIATRPLLEDQSSILSSSCPHILQYMPQTLVSLSTTPSSSHDILRYRDKSFQISQMNLHHSFLKPELVGGAYSGHDLGFLVAVKQNLGAKALWNLKKVRERR